MINDPTAYNFTKKCPHCKRKLVGFGKSIARARAEAKQKFTDHVLVCIAQKG